VNIEFNRKDLARSRERAAINGETQNWTYSRGRIFSAISASQRLRSIFYEPINFFPPQPKACRDFLSD